VTVNACTAGHGRHRNAGVDPGPGPRADRHGLHGQFTRANREGHLITPERSAASLLTRLAGDGTGEIWAAPRGK
jgi:hypothetical protein